MRQSIPGIAANDPPVFFHHVPEADQKKYFVTACQTSEIKFIFNSFELFDTAKSCAQQRQHKSRRMILQEAGFSRMENSWNYMYVPVI